MGLSNLSPRCFRRENPFPYLTFFNNKISFLGLGRKGGVRRRKAWIQGNILPFSEPPLDFLSPKCFENMPNFIVVCPPPLPPPDSPMNPNAGAEKCQLSNVGLRLIPRLFV